MAKSHASYADGPTTSGSGEMIEQNHYSFKPSKINHTSVQFFQDDMWHNNNTIWIFDDVEETK